MTALDISVRNLQRKIAINVAEIQNFAANALRRCLQLRFDCPAK